LAKAIIEKHDCSYEEALETLGKFRLNLICDESIKYSAAHQAALLTSLNSGKRAFHGGVTVIMPSDTPCLLPWPGKPTLNKIAAQLGAQFTDLVHTQFSHTLYFGKFSNPVMDGLAVHCTGWRGGVAPADVPLSITGTSDFALGGVLAGALGVAKGFLRVSGLSSRFVDSPQGISLWRPDLDWITQEAEGPKLTYLPARIWLLGLGHLGQAFLWSIGLLPYGKPNEATFLLQDFDRVVEGNWSAGLLCEADSPGKCKTRLCAEWMEKRGFQTTITERPFDLSTKRSGEEPYIAMCGFDSPIARRGLEEAGFDLIVECGLGATTDYFDSIMIHTFPGATQTPKEIWPEETNERDQANETFLKAFKTDGDCGIVAETLAKKAISSSFVGAFAASLAVGELLRGLHGGDRCEIIKAHLRSNDSPIVVCKNEVYQKKFGRNGFLSVQTK
jgi:hypothetical protein